MIDKPGIPFPADRGGRAHLARLRSEVSALRFESLHVGREVTAGRITTDEGMKRMREIFRDLDILAMQITNLLERRSPSPPEPGAEDDEEISDA